MELLDAGNTGTYGHPVPTPVPLGHKKGKAILVSGHDLKDLEEILKQSEGKGINVYTHGEMLPCHGYPGLKKYPHFYGHLRHRLAEPGQGVRAVPRRHRHDHQLHPEAAGILQGQHLHHRAWWAGRASPTSPDHDFTAVIEKALAMPGFAEDSNGKSVMIGFARNAVLGVAGKVIDAVKSRHDPPLLPGGRLRRRQTRPELLHRVRGESAQGLRGAHPGLRQVPLL